ncbi:MAG: co-chaperone GroES [Chloracidobacterium sp.]|nr:co-chaperone GroES [Chloracidobacterium sp.]
MAKFRPLHDRVVIRRTEENGQMVGGLYVPDTAKEKPQQGEVIAVGDGRILEDGARAPIDLNVGDQVLFGKYSGTEVKIDDEEYLIMKESDVFGVVESATMANTASAQRK